MIKQTDTELLFERMACASQLALNAIEHGILCQIKVDSLGLVVDATWGKGDRRLSLRKIVGYSVLMSAKFDALGFTVKKIVSELMDEVKVRVRST